MTSELARAAGGGRIDEEAEALRGALTAELAGQGLLSDPAWERAVRTAPRHRFVPGFYADSGQRDATGLTVWEPVTASTDARRWLESAYQDATLITQLDGEEPDWEHPSPRAGGAPTSSSTLPSLVLRMWQDADISDGQAILEIGTGTGYSTALACERLNGTGEVTSLEVDSRRLARAAAGLYGSGYFPDLAAADGLYGYARVLLTASGPAAAGGPLLPGTISFMAARAHERPEPGNPAHWASLTRDAEPREVRHDWTRVNKATDAGFFGRFIAQLAAPGAQLTMDGGDGVHLVDVVSGSAATFSPGQKPRTVRQVGPRRLWDAIEAAWDSWDAAGQPGPEKFYMRVSQGEQIIGHTDIEELTFRLPA